MKHKNSHLLVGYWSRLRAGREVPGPDRHRSALHQAPSVLHLHSGLRESGSPGLSPGRHRACANVSVSNSRAPAFWPIGRRNRVCRWHRLLRQALKLRQPVCLSSIAATADNGMVELETVLTPVSFNGGEPQRFFGLVQMLSDPTPLLGRTIAYQRLIASQLVREDEPVPQYDQSNLPPPPPPGPGAAKSIPRRPIFAW